MPVLLFLTPGSTSLSSRPWAFRPGTVRSMMAHFNGKAVACRGYCRSERSFGSFGLLDSFLILFVCFPDQSCHAFCIVTHRVVGAESGRVSDFFLCWPFRRREKHKDPVYGCTRYICPRTSPTKRRENLRCHLLVSGPANPPEAMRIQDMFHLSQLAGSLSASSRTVGCSVDEKYPICCP